MLGFRDGALVWISQFLGSRWDEVPFDTLRVRFADLGEIAPRPAGDTSYVWSRDDGRRVVSISCGRVVSRCMISLGRAEKLER